MPSSTSSRLFRFILSLVIRLSHLRLSVGRISLALRSWLTSIWKSIPTLAGRGGQSWIRLHANGDPQVPSNSVGEPSQEASARVDVEEVEEHGDTLATLPVWRPSRWQDDLSSYRARHLKLSHPIAANPDQCSQRYAPRATE